MSFDSKNFEDFSNRVLEEMIPLQSEFMKLYAINSYENWFYDHGIGIFHFSSEDGRHLYFKYVDVGSYSTNTNTWKWSWDNDSTPRSVSYRLKQVREFGTDKSYKELTDGLIDGDEYTGWALTSVSAKILSALGMYRIPSDHLFIYFIFTNEVTAEDFQILKDKIVKCDEHETGITSFVCNHLIDADGKGFHEAFETEQGMELYEDDEYQAWCDDCEIERLKTDGWNDESMAFADIKVVCDSCYFKIKERNLRS